MVLSKKHINKNESYIYHPVSLVIVNPSLWSEPTPTLTPLSPFPRGVTTQPRITATRLKTNINQ